MKRVACYVRVSTEEQKKHGLSVDSQIVALQDYCKQNNYEIVGIYNDAGLSASKKLSYRKALLQLCDDCKANKIDLIIFTKLDRWFRSVADYYKIQGILDECNVPWKAIWEDYETETSTGKFKVNIMLSVAQAESDRTSERIKAVNEYRRASGAFVGGLAPLGYKVNKADLLIDPDTREGVQAFFDHYMLTLSPTSAIEKASEYGLSISRPRALRMLKADTYAGNANGYKCEAYITEDQHKMILESLEGRKQRASENHRVYYFSGLLRCPKCQGTMASHFNTCKVHGKKYKYKAYRCSRYDMKRGCDSRKVIFEATAEKYLLKELDAIIGKCEIEAEAIAKERKDVIQQKEKLESKLKRIGIRFEDGDITAEEYRSKRDQIRFEIQKIEASSASPNVPKLPSEWKNIYAELDDDHKKAFWNGILKSISYDSENNSFNVILK